MDAAVQVGEGALLGYAYTWEIRLRAVNVTTVARSRGPNAEPAIPPDKRAGFMN